MSVVKTDFVKGYVGNDYGEPENQNGGALFLTHNSSIVLDRSSFMNNAAFSFCGAIYMEDSSIVLKGGITRSDAIIFSNNSAYVGGAITATGSTITATEGITIFKNNFAEFFGAAIDLADSRVTLKNVNFFQNIAEYVSKFVSIIGHLYKMILLFFCTSAYYLQASMLYIHSTQPHLSVVVHLRSTTLSLSITHSILYVFFLSIIIPNLFDIL